MRMEKLHEPFTANVVLCFKVSQRFKAYIKEEVLISKLAPRLKREMIMIILLHSLSIAKAWHLMWLKGFQCYGKGDVEVGIIMLMAEILHQLICSLSHYLQGFIHAWWCRISAINSCTMLLPEVASLTREPVCVIFSLRPLRMCVFFSYQKAGEFSLAAWSQHGANFSVSQITPSVRKWRSLGLVGTSIGCRWAFGASPALFVLKVVDTNWLQAAAFKKLLYFGFRIYYCWLVQKPQTSSWGW